MKRLLLLLALLTPHAGAQAPVITQIDPPNWWPAMPAPMLLLRGEHLTGATITLTDRSLHIDHVATSENGHYLQLWLANDASKPETIQVKVHTPAGEISAPFTFEPRHPAGQSFAGFSSKDVMYLIMTDRFADGDSNNDGPDHATQLANPRGWHGGDLRGVLDHLDYLQQLGITTVWVTPVYQNHGRQSYHGYGATDLYRVDEHFGSLDDLQALADGLHARHMKLVLDTVPNHIGATHPWVTDSPDPLWFHGTLAHHTRAQGEFAPVTDPHAPWRDQQNVTQGWFANVLPDLNQENPAVSRYLIQNTLWWIEQTGADGLRIDTFPYVGRPFWHDFHTELHSLFPHLTTVGEVYNGDPTITSAFAGGVTRTGVDTGLDTPFDFPTYFALRNVFLKDEPMTELARILRLDNLFPHPERLVPFLGNHDTSRFMNDPQATPARFDLAFTTLLTMRGMPQIYSGDEIAMRGGEDPDNRHDFPTFDLAQFTPDQRHAFNTVQQLLTLRRQHPALQSGDEQILDAGKDTFVYVRSTSTEHVLIAINKALIPQDFDIPTDDTVISTLATSTPLLGDATTLTLAPHRLTLHLAAQQAVLFDLK